MISRLIPSQDFVASIIEDEIATIGKDHQNRMTLPSFIKAYGQGKRACRKTEVFEISLPFVPRHKLWTPGFMICAIPMPLLQLAQALAFT
jgi:hypothetical protein